MKIIIGTDDDIEELKGRIARAIYETSNKWIAENFPEDHLFCDFSQVNERTCNLHFDYAEAVIAALSPADRKGTP
jgi:tetrahydromethanopterin S-methyltransferase subunit B